MEFTNIEIERMKNNTNRVIEYLKTLEPQVRERIFVKICYGLYVCCDEGKEFHIYECDNRDNGFYYLEKNEAKPNRQTIEDMKEKLRIKFMSELCTNWKKIKAEILKVLDEQNRVLNSINNFEL